MTIAATDMSKKVGGQPLWMRVLAALGPLLGLALVVLFFSIKVPKTFVTVGNFKIILMQTAVVGIAALGATLIIISAGIDLSVGSNIAMCTVVVTLFLQHEWSPLCAALGGVVACALVGLLIGLLVTQLRLSPFIATLGLMGALRGGAKQLADNTTIYPPNDTWLDNLLHELRPSQQWMILPPGVWLMLILAILVAAMLRYTRFGRHIFAIGSNVQTARLCGVPVKRTLLLMYATAGALAGVAGVLQFSHLGSGDPTTADGYELRVIAAVVIGGTSLFGGQGSIFGSLIGALLMTTIASGCTKMEWSNSTQDIITGAIIILAATLDELRQRKSV